MRCPYCSSPDTRVIESRESETSTRRRRACETCAKRFTTYERVETAPLTVIKKDGTRQAFDRGKLLGGIMKACEKRPVTAEQIETVVEGIEAQLRAAASTDIPSRAIGELVMDALSRLDKVAFIRFASVYRDFQDPASFIQEATRITHLEE